MLQTIRAGLCAIVFAAALTAPLPLAAQTSASDVKQKTSAALSAIGSYTVDKKDQAMAEGKKLVADMDRRMKELETQAAQSNAETKAAAQQAMVELKQKHAKASQKLSDLGNATSASWDSVKSGFTDAYKDLADSFEKAASKLHQ
ncbi:MAG TPA: hypothetical protein VEL75_01965 [Candidatus Methylomirabilis sp.]|nr:hypothetical protein [Candidatus Methylomirabilis sp.]